MRRIIGAAVALCLATFAANAATLRVSSAGDAGTLDPHSQNIIPTAQLLRQIYEPLVNRGPSLELEPALAESWSAMEPTRWRFKLRAGVKFQDGSPFTADDVVFSLKRAAAPSSNYGNFVDTVVRAEAVDPLTVDVITSEPDPILVDKLSSVVIMSKAWCEANNATAPQNAAQAQESYTTRHTNGTGPYQLTSREAQVRTVLDRNAAWWGTMKGNVTQYVSLPIANASTRLAAFLSGEVDVLLDPPLQDIPRLRERSDVRVLQGPEIRSMFIVMDQARDELLYSDVKGRNPLKDHRVRQALYQAIDIQAIRSRILRGFALPAGVLFGPGVRGYDKAIDQRLPLDIAKAKALLAEAGYPDGFAITLDCPNNRYINDADVCTALGAMWAKIGVRVAVNAQPLATFFPKVQRKDTSMFFLGSGSPTLDAYYILQIHLLPPTGRPGDGAWNLGGYNNPAMTDLINKVRAELDPGKRDTLIHEVLALYKQDIPNLPLYHQEIAWAARANVDVHMRPDNELEAKWVTVK
ncbi:ABC transporter substrate-binding protein [Limobrevibacterium gyesilva]|uniref:ABC transporter substrate-binding protein n=1 Tax=Limobrevibacterium gyesilva TaxID=2991712 RepID=A0AA41YJT4_9PROT|nr:ABC transporter substrate-binding protein [Limobrevibacterium gyesilva]MCW3475064.1 ABC transporter substrate-binding protein [Limobrevibacterium gyesilva]